MPYVMPLSLFDIEDNETHFQWPGIGKGAFALEIVLPDILYLSADDLTSAPIIASCIIALRSSVKFSLTV